MNTEFCYQQPVAREPPCGGQGGQDCLTGVHVAPQLHQGKKEAEGSVSINRSVRTPTLWYQGYIEGL